jgi:hypothetical protein
MGHLDVAVKRLSQPIYGGGGRFCYFSVAYLMRMDGVGKNWRRQARKQAKRPSLKTMVFCCLSSRLYNEHDMQSGAFLFFAEE